MKTFEQHINQNLPLIPGFNFTNNRGDDKYDIFFYSNINSKHSEWIFYYNKIDKKVGVDYKEYNKLNNKLDFEDFIKQFNLDVDYISRYNS